MNIQKEQHIKLRKIRLQNITCFDDITLDLTVGDSQEPASWVVFLGENSSGKSTLLQMISIALMGPQNLIRLVGDIDWSYYSRSVTVPKIIQTRFAPDDEVECLFNKYTKNDDLIESAESSFKLDNTWSIFNMPDVSILTDYFYCGYGSKRHNNKLSASMPFDSDVPIFETSSSFYGLSTIYGNTDYLISIEDWFSNLYNKINFPNTPQVTKELSSIQYEKSIQALKKIFPKIEEVNIYPNNIVTFKVMNSEIMLSQLGDSYCSMIAWCIDLMARMFSAFPESNDPLKEHGIVLVDEIDAHLHPNWQRTVVETIRNVFPNLQFIVTSHSPFVAQDMRETDKIIILERSGDDKNGPVVAREETGSFYNWSADQILSAFFGLSEGTQGNKALDETKQYEELLDTRATKTLTANQQKQFAALTEKIKSAPLGDTPEEQKIFDTADQVLEALKNRRGRRK